jgi:signal transduction histidine kinase
VNPGTSQSIGDAGRAWFAPLIDPTTWRALGYLCVGLLASWLWFTVTIVVLVVSLPLTIVLIGMPLTVASFSLIARLADVERQRAALAGLDLAPRPLRIAATPLRAFRTRISDPGRWRQVAYMLTLPFVALALFAVVAGAWSAVFWALTLPLNAGSTSMPVLLWVIFTLLGVAGLGAAPRFTVLAAHGGGRYAEAFLSPSRVEQMQERVEELTEDRTEILEAVSTERRRIERNLHDGVQQRLVALGIDLGLASSKLADDPAAAAEHLAAAREKIRTAIGELRTIGRGLHPAILEDRGLDAALSAVVAGAALPINVDCQIQPALPSDTEETAYFVVSEAVGNILKHSHARVGSIDVVGDGRTLVMTITDDGRGGASLEGGTGLAGMAARVRGHDGSLTVSSPQGGPTVLRVELPYERPSIDYRR